MRRSNTRKQQIEWRRMKIDELSVKGYSQADICRMLNVDKSAVSRDLAHLREEAEEMIKNHIQKTLPYEYSKCLQGLQEIIKEAWTIAENTEKPGERLQSLSLIKDSYSTKMELLTNANLLSDSVKWVEQTKDKLSNNKVNNNSNGLERSSQTNNTESTATTDF